MHPIWSEEVAKLNCLRREIEDRMAYFEHLASLRYHGASEMWAHLHKSHANVCTALADAESRAAIQERSKKGENLE